MSETEQATLTHRFETLKALNNAYMSFVRDGGIFIPTQEIHHLGDNITLTLTLPENNQTFAFTGEVIWVAPKLSTNNNHAGIGVQCNEDEGEAFRKASLELLSDFKDENAISDTL
jgi:type IV pilus assembly protein PilZ